MFTPFKQGPNTVTDENPQDVMAKDVLNDITRHLDNSDKKIVAEFVVAKLFAGFSEVETLDELARRVGIDPYHELDYLINNDMIFMLGLQAWKAKRKSLQPIR
jgi:hypothetical protein